jgi:hypothetical protein
MKSKYNIIIIIFLLTNCKYFQGDNCNNTEPIVGKYENIYDKEAKNILVIKKDGTFHQIFKKGNITKENKGTWRFFEQSCDIYLNNLKLLHNLSESNKKYFSEKGIHRLNNIVFVEGMSYEFNFYRID